MPSGLLESTLAACSQGVPTTNALETLARGSVQGVLFAHALNALNDQPTMTPQTWRSSFEEAGRLAHSHMQRYLGALGTIASAAPLLGLLGTVIGMIEIFANQNATLGAGASADPAQLAHGISVALYNTAFGLMIAVPSLMAWRLLRAKVDAYTLEMEVQAERFWRRTSPVLCRTAPAKVR